MRTIEVPSAPTPATQQSETIVMMQNSLVTAGLDLAQPEQRNGKKQAGVRASCKFSILARFHERQQECARSQREAQVHPMKIKTDSNFSLSALSLNSSSSGWRGMRTPSDFGSEEAKSPKLFPGADPAGTDESVCAQAMTPLFAFMPPTLHFGMQEAAHEGSMGLPMFIPPPMWPPLQPPLEQCRQVKLNNVPKQYTESMLQCEVQDFGFPDAKLKLFCQSAGNDDQAALIMFPDSLQLHDFHEGCVSRKFMLLLDAATLLHVNPGLFCTSCGAVAGTQFRFCAQCGKHIIEAEPLMSSANSVSIQKTFSEDARSTEDAVSQDLDGRHGQSD